MQVDSQGRGLEHYARDSWRMTEQEKVVSSLLLHYLITLLFVKFVLTDIWTLSSEASLKVVTSEKIGGSGVTSTPGTWYGGVVMGVLLS